MFYTPLTHTTGLLEITAATPRYATFVRVFKSRWKDILKFRGKTLHLDGKGVLADGFGLSFGIKT